MINIAKKLFVIFASLQCIIWTVFGAVTAINQSQHLIIALFMLINGLVFICCIFIYDKRLILQIGVILFIAVNLLLTVTD